MGLITEMRIAARENPYCPILDVGLDDYEKLKKGLAIILEESNQESSRYFRTAWLLILNSDKIGTDFTNKDLRISKLRLPPR
jgi:hypothetical protein